MLPVTIGDAMASTIQADIMARTAQAGVGPDNNVKFRYHASEVGGIAIEAMVDGSSALIYPIDPKIFAACGNDLLDRLNPVIANGPW